MGTVAQARSAEVVALWGFGAVNAALVGVVVLLPWERWPTWSHVVPPLSSFVLLAVLRELTGGSTDANSVLVVLPVLWLALHGPRWALWAGVAAAAVTLVAPAVVLGAPAYPLMELGHVLFLLLLIALLAPTVQGLVRRLRERDIELSALNKDLDAASRQWELFGDQLADTTVFVVDWNMRYRQVTGGGAMRVGVQDWVDKTVWETSSPENAELLVPLYVGALSGQAGECELPATNNARRHQVSVVPFMFHGEPAAMVIARDVSLAVQRENEIRLLNERVEQLVDESPVGVAVVDAEGRVVRVNAALSRLLGLSERDRPEPLTLAWLGLAVDAADLRALLLAEHGDHLTVARTLERPGAPLHVVVDAVALAARGSEERSFLVNVHDVSAERQLESRLRHLAARDPLTGLANRRTLEDALGRHLRDCSRYGLRGAVLMLDLDHFKQVNDTRGHDAGDQLLNAIAAVLPDLVRGSDLVARMGGDEFVALLPWADHDAAVAVAQRLVEAVREVARTEETGSTLVTASVGIALVDDVALSPRDVLVAADQAMYRAKADGRDTYRVAGVDGRGSPLTPVVTPRSVALPRDLPRDHPLIGRTS